MSDNPFFDHDGLVEEQQRDDEERGDIGMALRGYGFDDTADDVDGCTIEDARAAFFEVVGVEWNWEAQKDKWVAEALHYAAIKKAEAYDPHGETKHRYYEEN